MDSKKYKAILANPPWDVGLQEKHGVIKRYELMPLDRILVKWRQSQERRFNGKQ